MYAFLSRQLFNCDTAIDNNFNNKTWRHDTDGQLQQWNLFTHINNNYEWWSALQNGHFLFLVRSKPVRTLKWSPFRDSVNEATDITSTTLDLVIDVNGNQTVIDRQMVECDRVFTVNNEMDLADGAKLTSGMTAELATMKIISSGELNYIKLKYS